MDGWPNGPMDGQTDGWTDTPSYRDARTHLKIKGLHDANQWYDEKNSPFMSVSYRVNF